MAFGEEGVQAKVLQEKVADGEPVWRWTEFVSCCLRFLCGFPSPPVTWMGFALAALFFDGLVVLGLPAHLKLL